MRHDLQMISFTKLLIAYYENIRIDINLEQKALRK